MGENCVISAVTLRGEQLPADTVLHGLKQKDGRFVVRVYGVQDNPKVTLEDGGAFLNSTLPDFLGNAGMQPGDLWSDAEGAHYLWTAKLYPVCDTIEEAVAAAVKLLAIADGTADEATRGWYAAEKRLSLQESFEQADVKEITAWQAKLGTRVRIARFLLMLEERKSIEETRRSSASRA